MMILNHLRGDKQPSQKLKLRDSQMELLRIVAMSMILIHHFVVHGSPYSVRFMEEGLGWQNAFVFYGVNLFVLISGFYGIKVRWRSFLSLLITLFLFAMVDFLLKCGFGWYQHGFDASDLTGMVRVLIHPFKKYWFISCYLVLYIFAPVINLGLKHATKAQLRTIVVIAMGYCIYGGFSWLLFASGWKIWRGCAVCFPEPVLPIASVGSVVADVYDMFHRALGCILGIDLV